MEAVFEAIFLGCPNRVIQALLYLAAFLEKWLSSLEILRLVLRCVRCFLSTPPGLRLLKAYRSKLKSFAEMVLCLNPKAEDKSA